MSDDDLIRRGDALAAIQLGDTVTKMKARIAALPARGVGDYTLAPHLQKIVEGAKAATQWDMQADRLAPTEPPEEIGILRARIEDQATEIARLTRIIQMQPPAPATTDAAHVNETPKSEHDAGNVLTAAQAREADDQLGWNELPENWEG